MKRSPYWRYEKRKYKKSGFTVVQSNHNRYYTIDNRNRCLSDTIFGRVREEGCDCLGCVSARKEIRKVNFPSKVAEALGAPTSLGELLVTIFSNDDIRQLVIERINSSDVNSSEEE